MTELVHLACALLCDEGFTVTFRRDETIEITRDEGEVHILRNKDFSVLKSTPDSFGGIVTQCLPALTDVATGKLKT